MFKSSLVCAVSCVKFGGATMDILPEFEPQQNVCDIWPFVFFHKRWIAQACQQLCWAHLCPFWPLCVHTSTFCHQCWCLLPLPAACVAWRPIFGVNSLGNSAGESLAVCWTLPHNSLEKTSWIMWNCVIRDMIRGICTCQRSFVSNYLDTRYVRTFVQNHHLEAQELCLQTRTECYIYWDSGILKEVDTG